MNRVLVLLALVLSGYLPAQNASLYLYRMGDTSLSFVRDLTWAQQVRAFGEEMPHDLSVRFLFGDTTHALVHCLSDWYTIENGQWKNQYRLFSHGFTCGARLFFENGYPVLYGGYGIWRGQSLNIRFVESGEWEMTKSASMPEYLKAGPAFHYNDTSIVVMPGSVVNVNKQDYFDDIGYIVHPNGVWEPVTFDVNGDPLIPKASNYHQELISDGYRIYSTKGGKGKLLYIQDKQSGNIYETTFEYSSPSESSFLRGDTLTLIGDFNTSFYIPDLIRKGGNISVRPHTPTSVWVQLAGSIGTLLVFLFPYFVMRSKGKTTVVQHTQLDEPEFYQTLLGLSGSELSTEKLGEVLELHSLSYDMVRKRRSLILKSINEYHETVATKPLVVRVPNPEDKRQYIYRIEK